MIQPNRTVVKPEHFPIGKLNDVTPIAIFFRAMVGEQDDRINGQSVIPMEHRKIIENPSVKILVKSSLMLKVDNKKSILIFKFCLNNQVCFKGIAFG